MGLVKLLNTQFKNEKINVFVYYIYDDITRQILTIINEGNVSVYIKFGDDSFIIPPNTKKDIKILNITIIQTPILVEYRDVQDWVFSVDYELCVYNQGKGEI